MLSPFAQFQRDSLTYARFHGERKLWIEWKKERSVIASFVNIIGLYDKVKTTIIMGFHSSFNCRRPEICHNHHFYIAHFPFSKECSKCLALRQFSFHFLCGKTNTFFPTDVHMETARFVYDDNMRETLTNRYCSCFQIKFTVNWE